MMNFDDIAKGIREHIFLLEAENPKIHTSFDNGVLDEDISIDVNQKYRHLFKISSDYLFSNKKFLSNSNKEKIEVEGFIVIRKTSCLAEDRTKTDAIGFVQFYKGDEESSASLYFNIFVTDELFNKIYTNISNKLYITSISITAKSEKDILDIEWGGIATWMLQENDNFLALHDFRITFAQAAELDSDFVEKDESQKSALLDTLANEINLMKLSLYAIAIAVLLAVGMKLFN